MKKLRVGVIGLGMGRGHVKGFREHPAADVVALADIDEDRLRRAGDELAVKGRYADGYEMIRRERLDVVSVATPNKFHKPYAIAALGAGAHVLCEKPMAMNALEARRMIAAGRKAKRRIMINFSFRFNPQSQSLRRQVEAGVLGKIYFARTVWHRRRGLPGFGGWFGQKALAGGGPLIDLGVHRLDLALWLMDYPEPEWVMGSAYNPIASRLAREQKKKFDVEDLAAGFVKFRNGATLVIEASWAANIKENEFMETRLYGTKGGLVQRNCNEGYQFEAEVYTESEGAQYDVKLHSSSGSESAQFHFIDAIVRNRPHIATGEEGLIVMKILDAIYESARLGRAIRVR